MTLPKATDSASIDAVLFDLGGVLIELAGVEKMLEWSPDIDTTEERRGRAFPQRERADETAGAVEWLGRYR